MVENVAEEMFANVRKDLVEGTVTLTLVETVVMVEHATEDRNSAAVQMDT